MESGICARGDIVETHLPEPLQRQRRSIPKWKDHFTSNAICYLNEEELNIQLRTPGGIVALAIDGGQYVIAGYYGWAIASTSRVIYGEQEDWRE